MPSKIVVHSFNIFLGFWILSQVRKIDSLFRVSFVVVVYPEVLVFSSSLSSSGKNDVCGLFIRRISNNHLPGFTITAKKNLHSYTCEISFYWVAYIFWNTKQKLVSTFFFTVMWFKTFLFITWFFSLVWVKTVLGKIQYMCSIHVPPIDTHSLFFIRRVERTLNMASDCFHY